MTHISHDEIKRYGDGVMPRGEFLRVQKHLEECAECRRRVDEMYPIVTVAEDVFLFEESVADSVTEFHLNYEEHLKPFVFRTIGPIDREIVEAHVESCPNCQSDLRDLLQFHDELEREKEIAALSKRGFWFAISDWFAAGNRKMIFVAASLVAISIVGVFWIIPRIAPKDLVKEQPPDNASINPPNAAPNSYSPDSSPIQKDEGDPANRVKEAPTNEEVASLVFPKFLDDLKPTENEALRGGDRETKPIGGLAPSGRALRGSVPTLRWKALSPATSYDVSIYDSDFNPIASVSGLTKNEWRTPSLPAGRLYRWQVSARTENEDGKVVKFLGQSKFYLISKESERRLAAARTPLERVAALAESGLINEAISELDRFMRVNPTSRTGALFRRQLSAIRR